MISFKPLRNSVKVTAVHKGKHGETLYELTPTRYSGPWDLKLGTELVVTTVPKQKEKS